MHVLHDNDSVMSVRLECVKEGSKLRVKMRTPGYIMNANCQFPRDLRVEGRLYEVPVDAVKLMRTPRSATYFYSVKARDQIKVLGAEHVNKPAQVFQDENDPDCVVCMCAPKDTVFVPCGHYYTCGACAPRLKTCPICRANIADIIGASLVDV